MLFGRALPSDADLSRTGVFFFLTFFKMQFFFGLAALQLICAAGLVPAARVTGPQDRPAAGQVRIVGTPVVDYTSGSNSSTGGVVTTWDPTDELVTEGGNGCMTGSVGSVIAADNSFMTIIFSQFFAEVGPYVRNRHRAYCRLNVTLNSPGWTLDIDSMDFRGYYKLDPGVNATIKTKYKFGEQQGKVCASINNEKTSNLLTFTLGKS